MQWLQQMAVHKLSRPVSRVRCGNDALVCGTVDVCWIDNRAKNFSHAVLSNTSNTMGGTSHLGAVLKLLTELCTASKGPAQLTNVLQAAHEIMEKAGGSEKVCNCIHFFIPVCCYVVDNSHGDICSLLGCFKAWTTSRPFLARLEGLSLSLCC